MKPTPIIKSGVAIVLSFMIATAMLSALAWLIGSNIDSNKTTQAGTSSRTLAGSSLALRVGQAGNRNNQTYTLKPLAAGEHAILTKRIRLQAEPYRAIEIDLHGLQAGQPVYLLWRRTDTPQQTQRSKLFSNGNAPITIDLASVSGWHGTISELGLDIYGVEGSGSVQIRGMSLLPDGIGTKFSILISQWAGYQHWTQASINHLIEPDISHILHPTFALALVMFLTSLVLVIFFRPLVRNLPAALISIALVTWLFNDLIWQLQLQRQLQDTSRKFTGKNLHEKRLASQQGRQYALAQALKPASAQNSAY